MQSRDETGSRWYAVWTRSNHEDVAASHLKAVGLRTFLPTVELPSRRRDRKVTLTRPVFPGYLFVRSRLQAEQRLAILRAPGVVSLLGSSLGPQSVPDWQIRSIEIALASRHPVEVLLNLVSGRLVRIVEGALAGMEGVVVVSPSGNSRVAVSLELLGRSLVVNVPTAAVKAA
ncbi:MAG: UpxY family transcription antiterminator [Deltaproteobacteria bacterium]|nr:UpxY family transcription antiterminator [Deltaproteobacteria bacterium]